MYESAYEYLNNHIDWAPKNITHEDAKFILKTCFQSLSKIDKGRPVRNRMSLGEITRIINRDNISYETVCGVLNIFRLPDSTFIRPFINPDDIDTQFLSTNTILDITHEALIRNWELLSDWGNTEYTNYTSYEELYIQLERWMQNDKSPRFLLAAGNLSHFEKWYEQCKPSAYWLVKYDNSDKNREDKLTEAQIIADSIDAYLKQSRTHITKAENAKKRRKNIALISASGVILALSILMGFAFKEKANALKQEKLAKVQKLEAQKGKKEAEQERNKAIEANNMAKEQKQLAEANAQEALKAKSLSDVARKNAEKMRVLAEEKSQIAQNESLKALQEKKRADEQRTIAELARDSANALSMLATAQTLAFQAKQNYNNKYLNLEKAYKAFELNRQYGGYTRDASIYDGLYNSLQINGYNNMVYKGNDKIVGLGANPDNSIIIYTSNNKLMRLIGNDYTNVKEDIIQNPGLTLKAFILAKDILLSDENRDLYLVNSQTNSLQKFDESPGFITTATETYNCLYLSGDDDSIYSYELKNKTFHKSAALQIGSKATRLSASNNKVFAGTKNGKIFSISPPDNKTYMLDSLPGRISALAINPDGKYLIAGSSLGEIKVYDLSDNATPVHNILKADLLIENIAIAPDNSLMAVMSSDKVISIYDMNNWNEKPVLIRFANKNLELQTMTFNSNHQLVVCYTNNVVQVWETNNNSYAVMVKNELADKTEN